MQEVKTISLRVDVDLDRQLRIEAAKRDLNRSDFIRQTLTEKLAEIQRWHPQAGDGGDDD